LRLEKNCLFNSINFDEITHDAELQASRLRFFHAFFFPENLIFLLFGL